MVAKNRSQVPFSGNKLVINKKIGMGGINAAKHIENRSIDLYSKNLTT